MASSTRNNVRVSIKTLPSERRATPFTDKILNPDTGALRWRVYRDDHWLVQSKKKDARCQLQYRDTRRKCHSQLLVCSHCKLTLFTKCFAPYHIVNNLVGSKNCSKVRYTTEDEDVNYHISTLFYLLFQYCSLYQINSNGVNSCAFWPFLRYLCSKITVIL